MKSLAFLILLMFLSHTVKTRKVLPSFDPEKKIFIITLDGFRWNEIFYGADSSLIYSIKGEQGELLKKRFWNTSVEKSRKQLLPFFWNLFGEQGQVFGNRGYENKVDVANPYGLSYPGYSELLTGKVDLSIYNNSKTNNSNPNILDLLNNTAAYKGKVAAFTSWNVFPYILNRKRESFFLNSGDHSGVEKLSQGLSILNHSTSSKISTSETRDDEITYAACTEYLRRKKPSIVFLSFSGTDDAGHEGRYDQYLLQAHKVDSMMGALWNWVQSTPEYAGKTSFMITTDHGRGLISNNWHKHGFFVPGSTHAWLAVAGPAVISTGEFKFRNQVYLKNISELVFELLKNNSKHTDQLKKEDISQK